MSGGRYRRGHRGRARVGHTFDPQLDAPHTTCATCGTTFIGDYFGNVVGPAPGGAVDYATFVSTFDDGTKPGHHQQQIVSTIGIPSP